VPDRKLWQITVAVIATENEIDQITSRISGVVCDEPEHSGSCKTPWIVLVTDEDSLEADTVQQLKDAILDR
jgi:hypothetical protein